MKVFTDRCTCINFFLKQTSHSITLLCSSWLPTAVFAYINTISKIQVGFCLHAQWGTLPVKKGCAKNSPVNRKISWYIFNNHCPDGCLIHKLMMVYLNDKHIKGAISTQNCTILKQSLPSFLLKITLWKPTKKMLHFFGKQMYV